MWKSVTKREKVTNWGGQSTFLKRGSRQVEILPFSMGEFRQTAVTPWQQFIQCTSAWNWVKSVLQMLSERCATDVEWKVCYRCWVNGVLQMLSERCATDVEWKVCNRCWVKGVQKMFTIGCKITRKHNDHSPPCMMIISVFTQLTTMIRL